MTEAEAPKRGPWRQVRAVLVLLHVVAVLLLALPNPGSALNRRAWRTPAVQLELKRWSERLTAVGVETTPKAFEKWLYGVAKSWYETRRAMLAPFEPYRRYLGIRQPWTMFAAPQRFPGRLEIHIRDQGDWRPIYIARSDEHDWQATLLDHDRMRAAVFRYTWPQYAPTHKHLAKWLARRALEDHPEAKYIRVRFRFQRSPTPDELRDGVEPKVEYQQVHTFSAFGLTAEEAHAP